jgi:hyperosmotically inducible protein
MLNTKRMKIRNLGLITLLCTIAVVCVAQEPDNTKTNKRDKNPGAVTADQQKMNAADQELTRKIRSSIMAEKSLSTYAHNIKIVSQEGMVTLKGPVASDDEKKTVIAKAVAVTGSADKVADEISVKN